MQQNPNLIQKLLEGPHEQMHSVDIYIYIYITFIELFCDLLLLKIRVLSLVLIHILIRNLDFRIMHTIPMT